MRKKEKRKRVSESPKKYANDVAKVDAAADFEFRKAECDPRIPYHMQGDVTMETEKMKHRRRQLRNNALIIRAIQAFWDTFQSVRQFQRIKKQEFFEVEILMCKCLFDPEDFSIEVALQVVEEDWSNAGLLHLDEMDKATFFDNMFELVDLWTHDVGAIQYARFLTLLYNKITVDESGEGVRSFGVRYAELHEVGLITEDSLKDKNAIIESERERTVRSKKAAIEAKKTSDDRREQKILERSWKDEIQELKEIIRVADEKKREEERKRLEEERERERRRREESRKEKEERLQKQRLVDDERERQAAKQLQTHLRSDNPEKDLEVKMEMKKERERTRLKAEMNKLQRIQSIKRDKAMDAVLKEEVEKEKQEMLKQRKDEMKLSHELAAKRIEAKKQQEEHEIQALKQKWKKDVEQKGAGSYNEPYQERMRDDRTSVWKVSSAPTTQPRFEYIADRTEEAKRSPVHYVPRERRHRKDVLGGGGHRRSHRHRRSRGKHGRSRRGPRKDRLGFEDSMPSFVEDTSEGSDQSGDNRMRFRRRRYSSGTISESGSELWSSSSYVSSSDVSYIDGFGRLFSPSEISEYSSYESSCYVSVFSFGYEFSNDEGSNVCPHSDSLQETCTTPSEWSDEFGSDVCSLWPVVVERDSSVGKRSFPQEDTFDQESLKEGFRKGSESREDPESANDDASEGSVHDSSAGDEIGLNLKPHSESASTVNLDLQQANESLDALLVVDRTNAGEEKSCTEWDSSGEELDGPSGSELEECSEPESWGAEKVREAGPRRIRKQDDSNVSSRRSSMTSLKSHSTSSCSPTHRRRRKFIPPELHTRRGPERHVMPSAAIRVEETLAQVLPSRLDDLKRTTQGGTHAFLPKSVNQRLLEARTKKRERAASRTSEPNSFTSELQDTGGLASRMTNYPPLASPSGIAAPTPATAPSSHPFPAIANVVGYRSVVSPHGQWPRSSAFPMHSATISGSSSSSVGGVPANFSYLHALFLTSGDTAASDATRSNAPPASAQGQNRWTGAAAPGVQASEDPLQKLSQKNSAEEAHVVKKAMAAAVAAAAEAASLAAFQAVHSYPPISHERLYKEFYSQYYLSYYPTYYDHYIRELSRTLHNQDVDPHVHPKHHVGDAFTPIDHSHQSRSQFHPRSSERTHNLYHGDHSAEVSRFSQDVSSPNLRLPPLSLPDKLRLRRGLGATLSQSARESSTRHNAGKEYSFRTVLCGKKTATARK